MNSINFIHDWNGKLTAASVFTTIRARAKYGHLQVGEMVEIYLNGRFVTHADVLGVHPFDVANMNHQDELIAMLDTGYATPKAAKEKLESFTKGEESIIIILRRTQASLFQS